MKYEYFEKLLKNNNKSIYEIAKDLNVSQPTFSQWKNGKTKPKIELLEKLSKYFDVPITYFFTGEIIEAPQKNFSNDDLLLAREINKSDKLELIKDIIKIQEDEKVKMIQELTKIFLKGR